MFRQYCAAVILLAATSGVASAGYLDENPDDVFATVYERIGALPVQAAREPFVWLRLEELKRALRPEKHQRSRPHARQAGLSATGRGRPLQIRQGLRRAGDSAPALHRHLS